MFFTSKCLTAVITLQAKSEEALLQTRADFDSHVVSGRNEHAQISSKLESETQTRTRLESEVRHVINMMCIFKIRELGWYGEMSL